MQNSDIYDDPYRNSVFDAKLQKVSKSIILQGGEVAQYKEHISQLGILENLLKNTQDPLYFFVSILLVLLLFVIVVAFMLYSDKGQKFM